MLDIATDRSAEARILVIHLRGRIDALSAREFDEFFEDLLRSGERFFILRGNQLEAISSAGIGSLVKFVRRLRGLGGGAVFVGLPEEIRLLLEFFGLGELLPAYARLDEARAALEASLVRFQDKLEIKRESTLRTRVNPGRNRQQNRAEAHTAMRSYHQRQRSGRLHSESGTAHARDEAGLAGNADWSRDSVQASSGPTESELEIISAGGPAESELEVMSAAGPTGPELDMMSSGGPTESELEIMSAGGPTASEQAAMSESRAASQAPDDAMYEQAVLETELAREAGDADADDEFERLRETSHTGDHREHEWTEAKVMGCEQCGLNLRILNFGLHMCPACGIEFDVRRDGNVSFYEKL